METIYREWHELISEYRDLILDGTDEEVERLLEQAKAHDLVITSGGVPITMEWVKKKRSKSK